jgi:hypothetical protein
MRRPHVTVRYPELAPTRFKNFWRDYAPPGIYVVTAKLPERDGEFEYHIKHTSELHERIARESELQAAR